MKARAILILGLIAVLAITLTYAVFVTLTDRASKKVLQAIRGIEPGMSIDEVREELGKEMYELKDLEAAASYTSIGNKEFLKNKTLYWFYISSPNCRAIEFYTDDNGEVVYVTWRSL